MPAQPNGIYRIFRKTGEKRLVANLSRYTKTHPVANPNPGDFEPDGDWYSMVARGRSLYIVEANDGELVRMAPNGTLHRVVDFSAEFGHVVPTVVAFHRGAFWASNLTPFPFPAGGASLWRVTLDGDVSLVRAGLTTVLGLESHGGHLYALESSAGGNTFGGPGSGRIVRIGPGGRLTPVVTGLTRATAFEFRPHTDRVFISDLAFARCSAEADVRSGDSRPARPGPRGALRRPARDRPRGDGGAPARARSARARVRVPGRPAQPLAAGGPVRRARRARRRGRARADRRADPDRGAARRGTGARTRVLAAEPPAPGRPGRLAGRADIGAATAGRVSWEIAADGDGSSVRLAAAVERASPIDRALLALGGERWMRRVFERTLANLAATLSGPPGR